ncbi:MAG TPA: response regulator transcription factor [Ignavibacteria bacterium]|nr:response regulator transcription factor [Ignavibacteria bacterium]
MEKKKRSKIKVFIADDQPIVRAGLKTELEKTQKIECIGEASNGKEAVEKLSEMKCDIIFMDVDMPEMNGLKAAQLLLQKNPDAKIIALHENEKYVLDFLCMGAMGYLLKDVAPGELIKAVKCVADNSPYLSIKLDKTLLKHHRDDLRKSRATQSVNNLTKRETQILTMLANGFSNKEVAFNFKLSVRTVESHRNNIMKKLNIKTVSGLTKYAISKGIINAD